MTDTVIVNQSAESDEQRPILVAIDFSEDSKAAMIWGYRYSKCCGAPLTVLHVVHDPVSSPGFYRREKENHTQTMQEVAESMMNEFLDRVRLELPDLPSTDAFDIRFVPGLPPSRIVEVADLLNVCIVVIGSRGKTGLEHMLLGSVAERVVELAHGPVVVVKSDRASKPSKKEIKRMEKKQRKERENLKGMLGMIHDVDPSGFIDG